MAHGPRFVALCDAARAHVTEISCEALAARREAEAAGTAEGPRWITVDVREDGEWAAGRMPCAIHLGKGVIERDIEEACPDLDAPLVLYCGGGYRSALAARALQDMGYTNVRSLAGGRRRWQALDLPWTEAPA